MLARLLAREVDNDSYKKLLDERQELQSKLTLYEEQTTASKTSTTGIIPTTTQLTCKLACEVDNDSNKKLLD